MTRLGEVLGSKYGELTISPDKSAALFQFHFDQQIFELSEETIDGKAAAALWFSLARPSPSRCWLSRSSRSG